MSLAKWSMGLWAGTMLAWSLASLVACSASNDAEEIAPNGEVHYGPAGNNDSDDSGKKDSDKKDSGKDKKDSADVGPSDSLDIEQVSLFGDSTEGLEFVYIPSISFNRGATYSISSYYIATTEVTQELYKEVVGSLPKQDKVKDSLPVVNVSWYDAVLFCNELSKLVGLDTVYSYKSVGDENFLEDLKIDYSVEGIRLPTEIEWEVAAHGGVYESAYYWGTEPASNYAYYGQTKGPTEVAQFIPNAYGLYDMAGNVAEWVNDWYASYSTKDEENPVGPATGTSKCVRGGGWTDKVAKIAPKERDKKDPLYHGVTVGFRIAYSKGF
jgi:Uncharacterized conserved protein